MILAFDNTDFNIRKIHKNDIFFETKAIKYSRVLWIYAILNSFEKCNITLVVDN